MGHVKMIAFLETHTQFSSTANWENHPREEAAELWCCMVLWCHCDCQLLLVSATAAKAAASKPEVGLGGDGRQYMGTYSSITTILAMQHHKYVIDITKSKWDEMN
jgi:hypothetical protein